jgi:hypothetical protein
MNRQVLGEMLVAAQDNFKGENLHSDEIVVTRGDVVDCIVQEARANEIDLIVMLPEQEKADIIKRKRAAGKVPGNPSLGRKVRLGISRS